MMTKHLGKGISNPSGLKSLADIGIESPKKISDSLRVIEKSFGELSDTREKIELFNLEKEIAQFKDDIKN